MNNAELVLLMVSVCTGLAYGFLILSLTKGWNNLKNVQIKENPSTDISVIIPVRNEEDHIKSLISALQSLDYPENLCEFILINDHSTDKTKELLMKTKGFPGFKCLDLPEGKGGKKAAINLGIINARGKLITTLDADCIPGSQWLKTISSYYEDYDYRMISGAVSIRPVKGWFSSFQALELLSLVSSGGGAIGLQKPIMCNGANLTYEKSAFLKVGGFNETEHIRGGDDIFLMEKFNRHYSKGSIGFIANPEGIVHTRASKSLRSFLKQRFRWIAKSPAYKDPFLISTSIIVLIFNLCMLSALLSGIFSLWGILIFGSLFLFKCIIDFPILWNASKFAGQTFLMQNYVSFQLIYFIFISFSGIMGNLLSVSWKGRK